MCGTRIERSVWSRKDLIRKEITMNSNRIRRLIGLTSVGAMAAPAHALNPQPIPPGHTH